MSHQREIASYNAIGTSTSPATLTAAFTGNRITLFSKYMRRMRLEITFTPGAGSTNQFLLLLIETTNEEAAGGPTNFYPLGVQINATTEVDYYADSGTSMGTGSGIPIVIPGDKTTTASQAISTSFEVDDLNATYVRLSVRDSGSANFGTCYVRATFSSP